MKKFVRLGAVLTALILTLVCFVACSSGGGDDDNKIYIPPVNTTDTVDNTNTSSLDGLWMFVEGDAPTNGRYIKGNEAYDVYEEDGVIYYYEWSLIASGKITVNGDRIEVNFFGKKISGTFEIKDGKFTVIYDDGDVEVYRKVDFEGEPKVK